MLTLAEVEPITSIAGKVVEKGLATESVVLITVCVVIVLPALVYSMLWKWGGLRESKEMNVKIEDAKRDAMAFAKDIADINAKVLTQSNGAYAALIEKHRAQLDRSPSLRMRSESKA